MKIPLYHVDAFTSAVFSGNPAAVCFLDDWLDDALLQSIAAENNVSETAFLVHNGNHFDLRWFTPTTEVALCGHATLASAFVLFACRGWAEDTIRFQTRESGQLRVSRRDDLLELDFPSRPARPTTPPVGLDAMLGVAAKQVLGSAEDLLVLVEDEEAVLQARPDFTALTTLAWRGIIITAPGRRSDFVSRFFGPAVGVAEDPVTGSAHCVLTPYWSAILNKKELYARQVSRRGGELWCRQAGERVHIRGRAALYLQGVITV